MESIRRFRDEYQEYLDPEFLLAYYIITEALLMADSRVKNMMIATWGKEERTFKKDDGTEKIINNYIWYPIFYDMDTMLGLDNIGYVNKNYYDEDTTENVFNGDEVLWKFVRDALPNEVAQFYNRLEGSNSILTKNQILPFFNNNQANLANETFYNEDALYKYINTFRTGYTNHLTGEVVEPGEGTRLYAAQGDRSMMREWFLDNRIKYLRGKYSSAYYQDSDRIEFRLTYPKYQETSENQEEQDRINASIAAVPPSGDFEFTSLKTGFAGVKIGKNSTPTNKRFVNEQTQIINVDTSSGNGTETYLLGISNLASVGDLSNKYLYKLIIKASENNLKSLILGNHHKDYYNPFWKNESSIELTGFRFLEEFNLENCDTFKGGINFSNSPQIKRILLNGSKTSDLTLPVGGVLEELRVPSTITDLKIDSHPTLKDTEFTVGDFDYNSNQYVNNFSRLQHILIKDCPHIDTYSLICGASIYLPDNESILESYCIQNFNWVINNINDLDYDEDRIVGIKILDYLTPSDDKNLYPYKGEYNQDQALIGSIQINCKGIANEFDIYQKYHKDFPNVTITYGNSVDLEAASEIKFYNSENINENSKPYYTVLSNGKEDLKFLTSLNGPANMELADPQKLSTSSTDFNFEYWVVYESFDEDIPINTTIRKEEFENYIPNGDLKLIPYYSESVRLYEIILYDYDGITELIKDNLPYGKDLSEAFINNSHSYYNYRVYDGNRGETYRYEFKGWQSEYDYNNNPSIITYSTLEGKIVTGKLKLYAFYKEEDSQNTVSNLEFFDINFEDHSVKIKDKYYTIISGKITFPSKDDKGNHLTTILGYQNSQELTSDQALLTEIYVLNDASYTTIGEKAFSQFVNLKKNQILNCASLKFIGIRAFARCKSLELSILPESLESIGTGAFSLCTNISIEKFGTVDSAPNLKLISQLAFNGAGKKVSKMYIGNKDFTGTANDKLEIQENAFTNYGVNGKNIQIYTYAVNAENIPQYGFSNNDNISESAGGGLN